MRCSSISTPGSGATSEPVAMITMCLAASSCLPPPFSSTWTRPGPSRRPVPLIAVTLFLRNRNSMPWVSSLTTLLFWSCMRAEVELDRRHPDAEGVQAVARLGVELGGVQQRLGRDAADVEAGAAEARRACRCRPPSCRAGPRGSRRHSRRARRRSRPRRSSRRSSTPSPFGWCDGQPSGRRAVFLDPRGRAAALRILDAFLDAHQEAHRLAAVDDPVVVGQREIHHRPDHDLAVTATGRSWILCMPRMPTCGGLRIGELISEP